MGQEMQPWVSAKNEKVWGMESDRAFNLHLLLFLKDGSYCRIAGGEEVCCAWKHQADIKVKDSESHGGDKW